MHCCLLQRISSQFCLNFLCNQGQSTHFLLQSHGNSRHWGTEIVHTKEKHQATLSCSESKSATSTFCRNIYPGRSCRDLFTVEKVFQPPAFLKHFWEPMAGFFLVSWVSGVAVHGGWTTGTITGFRILTSSMVLIFGHQATSRWYGCHVPTTEALPKYVISGN